MKVPQFCAPWMTVGSLALSFAVLTSPPPETVAVFVTVNGALLATFTVSMIGGHIDRQSDRRVTRGCGQGIAARAGECAECASPSRSIHRRGGEARRKRIGHGHSSDRRSGAGIVRRDPVRRSDLSLHEVAAVRL